MTKIGIIGGGQLGKMMILEARKMGLCTIVLDPDPSCPASGICDELIVADFDCAESIQRLAQKTDVITYEFEHIGADTLLALEKAGKKVYPTAASLLVIQDKYTQKKAMCDAGIPVPDFKAVTTAEDIELAAEEYGYPLMLKSCLGGYDGKGNEVIRSKEEIPAGLNSLGSAGRLMVERFAKFDKEISVLACRGADGEIVVYPVAENTHVNSILDRTVVPADISPRSAETAMRLASEVMKLFGGVGMFCVEMFAMPDGGILINEVAPRPHNSGHYTIEACVTSQFENHIRAVAGLPLGDTDLLRPAVMRNLLGAPGSSGLAEVRGMGEVLRVHGAKLHIYGKQISKPYRKMGHITATGSTPEEARERADMAYGAIEISAARHAGE